MNPIGEFTRLRPDDNVTPPDLDAIWQRVVEPDQPVEHHRRWWLPAAAGAAVIVGVVAIGVASSRPASAPSVADTVTSTLPAVEPIESEETFEGPVFEAGDAPFWGVTADGWQLTDFVRTTGDHEMVELFAGPDGLAVSWIAIVRATSEPFGDVFESDRSSADAPIESQYVATDGGTDILVAAGISVDRALPIPDDFVASQSAAALEQGDQYRFEHDDGGLILVEVWPGGIPRAESILAESPDAVLVRHGFWVSEFTTTSSDINPTDIIVEVPENDWTAASQALDL